MRSDKFIGTASMVSIYGRNYNAFFKHVEIKFIRAEFTRTTPITTKQRPIFTLKLATFLSTWSSWILIHDRVLKIQRKLKLVKMF